MDKDLTEFAFWCKQLSVYEYKKSLNITNMPWGHIEDIFKTRVSARVSYSICKK